MATTSLHNDKRDAVAGRIEDKGARRRIVLAGTIGTTIEWYDFFIYAFIAPLVFDQLFFPKYEQLTATLAVFATFAAGFLVRPLILLLSRVRQFWLPIAATPSVCGSTQRNYRR